MNKQERHDALMSELVALRVSVEALKAEVFMLRALRPLPYPQPCPVPYRSFWLEPTVERAEDDDALSATAPA